ncbi:MAG: P-loop NTPase [Solobacterium sp.]|nr:P-loop NTPase [Solobacterium sp.]
MSEQNPETCNHNCEGCTADCSSRQGGGIQKITTHPRAKVKKLIGVVSGKGGVGKSFVTSVLASEMQRRGHRTAVLDGDLTGPSMGKVFGISEKAVGDGELMYPAVTSTGIQVVTMNMLLDQESQPVIWRGPVIGGVLQQFYTEVFWDDVDYMFVDMPPGTGDAPLTMFQSFPFDGIVIVTSPQDLVSMIVEKAINMAKMCDINVIGLVENMSYVECSNCKEKLYVFGQSHIQDVADKYGLKVLARIPLREENARLSDSGKIEELIVPEMAEAAAEIEKI